MKHWFGPSLGGEFCTLFDFTGELLLAIEEKGLSKKEVDQLLGPHPALKTFLHNCSETDLKVHDLLWLIGALGLKLSLVVHENDTGPVHPQIFKNCWEKLGEPLDNWELQTETSLEFPKKDPNS